MVTYRAVVSRLALMVVLGEGWREGLVVEGVDISPPCEGVEGRRGCKRVDFN